MTDTQKLFARRLGALKASEKTVGDIFELIFEQSDLVISETTSSIRRLSVKYTAAKADILALAGAISALGMGDAYIGLYGENSIRWIIAFWAILKSGNKPYLINLRQPTDFGDGILTSLGGNSVLDCDGKCCSAHRVLSYDSLMAEGKKLGQTSLPPCANELALSTNGTTLKEKVCFYTGRQLCEHIFNGEHAAKLCPPLLQTYKNRLKPLAFLPFYHIFGLEAVFLWYSFFGATFVFLPDMRPETILQTVRRHSVTQIYAVPLLWHGIEKNIKRELALKPEKTQKKFEKALNLSVKLQNISPGLGTFAARRLFSSLRPKLFGDSVRFTVSGGSFVNTSALRLLNGLGYHFLNGYGMTEVGISSAELSMKASSRLLGSIGRAFPSVEYSVGAEGQLLVRGSSLCDRMLVDGQPVSTDGWFDTGDIASIAPDGRAYIDGRISDIVFGDDGENLNPDLAERAFALTDAKAFCVTGGADNTRLTLVVQVDPGLDDYKKQRLSAEIERCNAGLPQSYKVRDIFFTADSISPPGAIKVSRARLRRELADGKIRPLELFAPEAADKTEDDGEIKAIVRHLFADILGISEADVTDEGHFMNDLGGSSLDYFTLLGEINSQFGVSLNLDSDSFGYTLKDFEKILTEMVG